MFRLLKILTVLAIINIIAMMAFITEHAESQPDGNTVTVKVLSKNGRELRCYILIANNTEHKDEECKGQVKLNKGKYYDISVRYFGREIYQNKRIEITEDFNIKASLKVFNITIKFVSLLEMDTNVPFKLIVYSYWNNTLNFLEADNKRVITLVNHPEGIYFLNVIDAFINVSMFTLNDDQELKIGILNTMILKRHVDDIRSKVEELEWNQTKQLGELRELKNVIAKQQMEIQAIQKMTADSGNLQLLIIIFLVIISVLVLFTSFIWRTLRQEIRRVQLDISGDVVAE